MTLPKYYLGVDGGGTNCRVRLADTQSKTLAEATGGRGNLQIEDGAVAYESVLGGAREAFAAAGIDFSEAAATYACLGMAGARLPSARAEFEARDWPFGGIRVFDDIDIARAGAHLGEDGAVLIIGTGSAGLALVRGERYQVGGWGFFVGDQMSGAIMGRELIRYAIQAADGLVEGSPLTEAVIARLGGAQHKVMAWSFDDRAPSDYGSFAPLFFEYFEKSDPVALNLMAFELDQIDPYVRYFRDGCCAQSLAIVGGFGQRLLPQLNARYGDYIRMPRGAPLDGAIILARQLFARSD